MKENTHYVYWFAEDRYFFYSIGSKGKFLKSVKFVQFGKMSLYEVLLEDFVESIKMYTLNTTTDNGDVDKIYSTIFAIMKDYSIKNPNKSLITMGTTKTIQRLDKIFIGHFYEKISETFSIYIFSRNTELCNKAFDRTINCDGYIFIKKK